MTYDTVNTKSFGHSTVVLTPAIPTLLRTGATKDTPQARHCQTSTAPELYIPLSQPADEFGLGVRERIPWSLRADSLVARRGLTAEEARASGRVVHRGGHGRRCGVYVASARQSAAGAFRSANAHQANTREEPRCCYGGWHGWRTTRGDGHAVGDCLSVFAVRDLGSPKHRRV